jgi:hypothetical protein
LNTIITDPIYGLRGFGLGGMDKGVWVRRYGLGGKGREVWVRGYGLGGMG